MSMYRAPSGALIFGAGTVQWSWGLDPNHDGDGPGTADVNMQQATVNLFADMGVQPATLQSGLVAASASTDKTPPSSLITNPASGAALQPFSVITIQGTASDVGGAVAGVEVSTDGGTTWHKTSGRANWSYSWNVGSGTINIRSRAVDDSGNLETPSAGISVNVAAAPFKTIFTSGMLPSFPDLGADQPVELGVRFRADSNGNILGVRFYKSSQNTGTHVGNLWSSSGALLATATFTNETASGWQQVNFSSPVPITANTVYIASYHTTVGHYSADQAYFKNAGVDNPPLHALQDAVGNSDGVYIYGSISAFPTLSFNSTNYWVDVAMSPGASLKSISVSPVNPTVVAGGSQQFSALGTYSDGSTADFTTQVTWSSSNTAVATISPVGLANAIAGGNSTITAQNGSLSGSSVLTVPVSTLAITTTSLPAGYTNVSYAASLAATGGTAPYNWSLAPNNSLPLGLTLSSSGQITGTPTGIGTFTFTIQITDGSVPQKSASKQVSIAVGFLSTWTIWSSTSTPGVADAGPDAPLELGVRFKSDISTTVTGIRFYKSAANTGPHVGNLWSSSGTLLATATFTNETASGWQQVNFSTPVAIAANTVYIASYHTTTGHYAADYNYFASAARDNAPLHALQDALGAPDGAYAYGSTSAFPNSGYQATNYWVDVVVSLPPTLNSMTVSPSNPTLAVGGTQQFTASGLFTDGSTQNLTSQVTWSSSNTAIATINAGGLATAVSAGTSVITAKQGTISASTNLTTQIIPLAITTTSLPSGTAGLPYSASLAAVGGQPPYVWSLASGATLPVTMTLSTAGLLSGTPTVPGSYSFTLQVTDSGARVAATTFNFTVANTPTSSLSIWPVTATPTVADAGPDASVELGVRFKSDVNGTITGIRFYKSAANVGPHMVNLWTSTGTLLATATSSSETASGWQQVNFATPVATTANTVYIASYFVTSGHYAADQTYFAVAGVDKIPLHALQDGLSGPDGVFTYFQNSTFPSSTYNSSNYWVDVAFVVTPVLNSISISPASPTISAGTQQQFTATGTFSNGSTANVNSLVTWSSSNPAVATVGVTGVATALSPGSSVITATQGTLKATATITVQTAPLGINASLAGGLINVPYSATLTATGGTAPYIWSLTTGTLPTGLTLSSAGVISGTPSAVGIFTFTLTVTDSGSPQHTASSQFSIAISSSIFAASSVPNTTDVGPDSSVELGVKFKSDVNGQIVGIRFYKSAANVGPHVVNLWSSTGTLLATAKSTSETASGWQQVNFATPVAITANTVYVASYFVTGGHYSVTQNTFGAAGVDNAPLHALQDGISGPNGAYSYGSTSSLPGSGYLSSNYWVDVAFQ